MPVGLNLRDSIIRSFVLTSSPGTTYSELSGLSEQKSSQCALQVEYGAWIGLKWNVLFSGSVMVLGIPATCSCHTNHSPAGSGLPSLQLRWSVWNATAIPFSRKDWPDFPLSFGLGKRKAAGLRSPYESKSPGRNRRHMIASSAILLIDWPSSGFGQKSSSSCSEMVPDFLKNLIVKVLKTVTKNFNIRFVVLAITSE